MIKKQYLKNKPLCKVTFSLPLEAAPDATEVKLLGDFNDWDWEKGIAMKLVNAAYTVMIELETGRQYEFRYLIDNYIWENDWEADGYLPTPYGVYNSIVSIEEVDIKTAPVTEKKPTKAAPAKKATTKKAAPKKADSKKDDLTKVEGIGPKIAEILTNSGIATFESLGNAKAKDIKSILEGAGSRYKMHDPTTWPKQAKLAAKGDWDKLAKLQDELKGGKKA